MKTKDNSKKYKIVMVDDHPLLRQGLSQLINQEDDLCFAGEAGNAVDAMKVIEKTKPDLVIIDISLKGTSGIDLTKSVLSEYPKMQVLVLSMHDESLYAERVLRAGAKGYLMKQEAPENIIVAVRKVLNGEMYLSNAMRENLLHKFVQGRPSTESPMESLTDRELEVLQLVAQGKGTRQIAEILHLSVKTIESHYANIKTKLNLKSAPELIQHAVKFFPSEI